MNEAQPIACDLTVFPVSVRAELAAAVPNLFRVVQTVQELADGYAFQFPNEPGIVLRVAHFIEHERQCCPFYTFGLDIEPNGGPIWLRLTGGGEVKQFIETVWRDLPGAVPNRLVQTGSDDDLAGIIAQAASVLADTLSNIDY
jgi:hypothetical protein